ncbi:MAG: VOC family protein [Mycobacterium sp.]
MRNNLRQPRITGAHHMGSSVRNLDRSIRFYCDVLGAALVREPYDGDSPSFCGRMAVVGLGKLGLDLFEHAGNGGELFEPARTGLDHVAFPTESVEELGAWASWLDTCNVSHSGVREVAGVGAMLNFVDPDGIQLEFLFIDRAKLST